MPPQTEGESGIVDPTVDPSSGAADETTGPMPRLDLGVAPDLGAPDDTCAAATASTSLGFQPVDVILVVDTSSSMNPVSSAVEANINTSLTAKLLASGIDVRVIALAGYGAGAGLCIAAPLGQDGCDPPGPLAPLGPLLYQYSAGLGSGSFLPFIVSSYTTPPQGPNAALYTVLPTGWHEWVRPGALKVFIGITDAEEMSNNPAEGDAFDAQLLALDPEQFGTAENRNYVFHTIAGLGQNSPASAPWLPSDPIVNVDCVGFSGKEPGQPMQRVSVLTGGLRWPLCEYGSFDVLFDAVATGVAETIPVACDLAIPPPDDGGTIDPDTLEVEYVDGLGGMHLFHQVPDPTQCDPAAFYVEGPTIRLCPAVCELVQADDLAEVTIRYGCDVGYTPNG